MTFNPHTPEDRAAMLATVGVDSMDAIFEGVPTAVRYPDLDLPRMLTEMEAAARLQQLADRNIIPSAEHIFLGAGSYQHYVPATVGQVLSRGEFYTAYTPYQPEVSQGTLQVIYEFQSMVADLLGTEVANASMYDGATALAEGALMTVAATRKKSRILVAKTVHPSYRQVMHTYIDESGVEIVEVKTADPFVATADDFRPHMGDDLASIVVSYPNFYGAIEDVQAISDLAHESGALMVVSTSPVPLSLLTPPGALGADVVSAEGQSLGVAQSYGGPYVGLLGSTKALVRQMPGRIAGITKDAEGKRGYVLTLQTREQHIRREKATSNICTNQGLMATAATTYMASVGPEGFREVGKRSWDNAHYLADQLTSLRGIELAYANPYFHEFAVKIPGSGATFVETLVEKGYLAGVNLGRFDDSLDQYVMLCCTELNSRAGIDAFVDDVRAVKF